MFETVQHISRTFFWTFLKQFLTCRFREKYLGNQRKYFSYLDQVVAVVARFARLPPVSACVWRAGVLHAAVAAAALDLSIWGNVKLLKIIRGESDGKRHVEEKSRKRHYHKKSLNASQAKELKRKLSNKE